ncbi:MAG: FAD-dependent oxidoreductase, partial [Acidobacteriota bacterium]|nr:FAD-dependent oxidoreductase [Acidobacteriota bacterium]
RATLVHAFPEELPREQIELAMMERMRQQAERFGAEILPKDATAVDFSTWPYRVQVGSAWVETKTAIIATGARARMLGVPGEREWLGRGVSTCATCDGAFFRDQVVGVVGGGDSAMEEALFLTRFASRVYVIHRRDKLRASKIMQDRAFRSPKIVFLWNTVVEAVHGEPSKGVTGVTLRDTQTDERREFPLDGLFVAIGHVPNTDLFRGQVELDERGYVVVDARLRTNRLGVFAAGDVVDPVYRQAITAAGMGCMAAIEAERYLEALEHEGSLPRGPA